MSKIQTVQKDNLLEGSSSPGITRQLAFKGEGCLVIRSRSNPGVISGWHHHGDYDVYGYVVSGSVRFESNTGEEDAVSLGRGDFFHVPPYTVHREINQSSQNGEVILFLRGTGPLVTNANDPGQA